jgi:hypothetical protein
MRLLPTDSPPSLRLLMRRQPQSPVSQVPGLPTARRWIALVVQFSMTNYINNVMKTDIDVFRNQTAPSTP